MYMYTSQGLALMAYIIYALIKSDSRLVDLGAFWLYFIQGWALTVFYTGVHSCCNFIFYTGMGSCCILYRDGFLLHLYRSVFLLYFIQGGNLVIFYTGVYTCCILYRGEFGFNTLYSPSMLRTQR